MTRRSRVALAAWLFVPATALAQPPPILVTAHSQPGLLTRITAIAAIDGLAEDDAFQWDADLGVDLDIVDFGHGRVNVLFNYEMMLASELQPFDPRQGNYTFDTRGTLRAGGAEVGLLFRHVSRHLGDRAKLFGIAWNDLGVEVRYERRAEPWVWQVRGLALKTVMRRFVDYDADLGFGMGAARRVHPRVSLIANATGHTRLVEGQERGRSAQYGARVEAGVRFDGLAAILELVAGAERRVDADPFEFRPRSWAFAGLRIGTK